MAILSKGTDFSTGEQVTAAKLDALVDSATFAAGAVDDSTTALDSSTPKKIIVKNAGISATQLATDSVTTVKIADSSSKTTGVTFAKMQHISTAKVLGRLSASEGDVEEVDVVIGGSGDAGVLFDNDDMLDNSDTAGGSATRGATQQSIKVYADAAPKAQMKADNVLGASVANDTESVTLPNGLIMKFGTVTAVHTGDDLTAVNFGTVFPNAAISAQLTVFQATGNDTIAKINSLTTDTLTIRNISATTFVVHWLVIGR